MDLTEAEDIKKRWQEYTEELHKNDLHDQDNHDGAITLADLTDDNASSGNSVLAVTQQLSISLGVAVSAAVLRVYEGMEGTTTVEQFHYTFITMGIITVASAAMFMLLKTTDGNNLIKRQRKSKPNRVPSESE